MRLFDLLHLLHCRLSRHHSPRRLSLTTPHPHIATEYPFSWTSLRILPTSYYVNTMSSLQQDVDKSGPTPPPPPTKTEQAGLRSPGNEPRFKPISYGERSERDQRAREGPSTTPAETQLYSEVFAQGGSVEHRPSSENAGQDGSDEQNPLSENAAEADSGNQQSQQDLVPAQVGFWKGLKRMRYNRPWKDHAYSLTVAWSAACIVLIAAATMFLWPHWHPTFKPSKRMLDAQVSVAAVGCLLFFGGSCLSLLEAVNKNRRNCPAWTSQPSAVSHGDNEVGPLRFRQSSRVYQFPTEECWHRHDEYRIIALDFQSSFSSGSQGGSGVQRPSDHSRRYNKSRYFWPSKMEVQKHLRYDWDVRAASIIAASSLIYAVSAFTAVGTTSTKDRFD